MAHADFENTGHHHFPAAIGADAIRAARQLFDELEVGAGLRMPTGGPLRNLLAESGAVGQIATQLLGAGARPVRLILFDKSAENNWSVGWHQDRVIAVRERIDVEGYRQWSVKDGILHVRPEFDLLRQMVTMRLHIDAVDATNAPLMVVDGSHKLGALNEQQVKDVERHLPKTICLAEAGDVWAYRTPILHASKASNPPRRRRTIQVDYAAIQPAGGLEWAFSL